MMLAFGALNINAFKHSNEYDQNIFGRRFEVCNCFSDNIMRMYFTLLVLRIFQQTVFHAILCFNNNKQRFTILEFKT